MTGAAGVPRPKLETRRVCLDIDNDRTGLRLPVLRDIDLTVAEGELVCIVGPSGCGKSTFLNAVSYTHLTLPTILRV